MNNDPDIRFREFEKAEISTPEMGSFFWQV